jgi:CSLREA domain-containing protein
VSFPRNDGLLAATITVTSLGDNTTIDGQVTLREAIEAANLDTSVDGSTPGSGADQIVFATGPGTILLSGAPLPAVVDDLTITGLGANQLTVDGADQTRVFEIAGGVAVQISDLTIARGRSTNDGAGILNWGTLTISNCTLSANATTTNGGGIFNAGTLTIGNSSFSSNSALNGGGIYNDGGGLIMNSTFSGNFTGGIAPFAGGGGAILNQVMLTVMGSTLSGNTAGNGGGMVNTGGDLTVINTTLSGNEAINSGGGISNLSFMLTITNSTFAANRSDSNGDATGKGGGISDTWSVVTIHNSVVARNFNGTGTRASDLEGTADAASSSNLIGVDTGLSGISNGTNGNLIGAPGAPIDPLLGPLSDNGGLTQTHALLSGSPAIDSGDDSLCPAADQRGVLRPHDGDGDGAATCDMSAFEVASCQGAGVYRLTGKTSKMHRLRASAPIPFRNLTIRLAGPSCADTTTTDSRGEFLFDNLAEGTYSVSPSNAACRFKRPSWTVAIAGKDEFVVFVGVCP